MFLAADRLNSVILCVDELDSLGHVNGRQEGGAAGERLTEFLQGIDFLKSKKKNPILIATTNYDANIESALFSRFDVHLRLQLPEHDDRIEFLQLSSNRNERPITLTPDEWQRIGERIRGFSQRDLERLLKLTANETVREMLPLPTTLEEDEEKW